MLSAQIPSWQEEPGHQSGYSSSSLVGYEVESSSTLVGYALVRCLPKTYKELLN